jgi:hypothetical protein
MHTKKGLGKLSSRFVLIESERLLYRGPEADHPTEIWDYPRGCWVPYRCAGPKKKGWGRQITPTAAGALKKNNPAAEHFMYYDMPPWSQPLRQAYIDATMPDHVKRAISTRERRTKP